MAPSVPSGPWSGTNSDNHGPSGSLRVLCLHVRLAPHVVEGQGGPHSGHDGLGAEAVGGPTGLGLALGLSGAHTRQAVVGAEAVLDRAHALARRLLDADVSVREGVTDLALCETRAAQVAAHGML